MQDRLLEEEPDDEVEGSHKDSDYSSGDDTDQDMWDDWWLDTEEQYSKSARWFLIAYIQAPLNSMNGSLILRAKEPSVILYCVIR